MQIGRELGLSPAAISHMLTGRPDRCAKPSRPEITEDEILTEHAALIWQALQAFATDPGYFESICDAAYSIEHKRSLFRENREAIQRRHRLSILRNRLRGKVTLDGECWTWTAATTNKGVPQMHRPGGKSGAQVTARAWTVEQWHGPDDTRWMVRASCGNRLCVNPEHATWRHVQRRN